VALAGGAGAIGLLALQGLVIREWCEMCVVADVAALAHAAVVLAAGSTWPAGRRRIAATAAIAMAVIGLPFLGLGGSGQLVTAHAPTSSHEHGSTSSPAAHGDLPEVVAREQVAGTAVVVDFIDFECQHCRALHPRLLEALERFDGPVKMVRKMVPLPGHRGALPAAIAWCCADAQGSGDAMAEALLVAPVEELTPEGCERIAASLGLDMDRYRSDAASRATFQRIQGDLADARAAGVTGLPTIYIGDQVFAGAGATVEELAAALARASEA
ncbi:MAG TPA: thioredoxin domain-containing protein, partial [Kofleriaceae bacterium]|nr:thioredoxin domain-containing protein [Kofleriaceae bacterium]